MWQNNQMNQFPVSDRVAQMHTSSTLKAGQRAAELREAGHKVVDLTVGEPDFDTPEFIKKYAIEGLQRGLTKYTAASGMKMFTESVSEYYSAQFGSEFSPSEVVASCGGKQGLFNAACTLLNPGDDLLIPKPYWVTFPEIATFCGANRVFVDTSETDFVLTAEQVRASMTENTKAIIINSPNNPTGRVIPKAEMIRIIETCAERNVYVITDECYLYFAYPPGEVFTSATLPKELRRYVCVGGSFSKTYAMTGWRLGFTIANEEWSRAMVKLQSHSATHPTSFVQYAGACALKNREATIGSVNEMLAEYKRRRDWLIPALNGINGFKCEMPEGAFYAFVDVRGLLGEDFEKSEDVADFVLDRCHTVVTDGAGFGAEGFIRISYATSMENLKRAVDSFADLFGKADAKAA